MPSFPKEGRKKFNPIHPLDSWNFPLGEATTFIRFSINTFVKNSNGPCFFVRLMVNLRSHNLKELNKELVATKIKELLKNRVLIINPSSTSLNEYIFSKEDEDAFKTLLKAQSLAFVSLKAIKDQLPSIYLP